MRSAGVMRVKKVQGAGNAGDGSWCGLGACEGPSLERGRFSWHLKDEEVLDTECGAGGVSGGTERQADM